MPIVERLTETDALFLHVERDDIVIQVAMVFVLDGPIAYDRYVDWLAPRLDRLPRLRHVLKRAPFNLRLPAWAEADRFDLGDHVSRDRVEAPGGAEQLRARVTELFARPLRRDIPLWRVHVIEGLEGNRSAIMLCTHHCLTDGAGFLEMAKVFFEDPPEGWPQHTQASREDQVRRRNGWAPVRVVRALMSRTGRARAGAMLRYLRAPGPWFPFSRPVSGRMHFAWWPVPLDELRAVRNASGATITEIVVSVLTGALA
ncbi:MAG: hypothetical protein FJY92_12305, partial [Candidatus Hydrogenedentes bacterium]|nr:hypothetical protein [Candidatus Hydrogenedentota bacterium]